MKIKFKGVEYTLKAFKYESGRKGLSMSSKNSFIHITKDLDKAKHTSQNHIYVKDYAKNTGIAVVLKELKLIEWDITNRFYYEFTTINEYKLTEKGVALWH